MQIRTKEYSVRNFEHLRPEELGQLDVFDRFVPGSLWNFTAFKGAFITTSGISDEEFFGTIFAYLNRGVRDITKFFQFSLKNISFLEVDPDSPIVILDKYLVVDNSKQKLLTEWNFDGSHVLLMNAVVVMKVLHKETFAFAKMNIQILLGKKRKKIGSLSPKKSQNFGKRVGKFALRLCSIFETFSIRHDTMFERNRRMFPKGDKCFHDEHLIFRQFHIT